MPRTVDLNLLRALHALLQERSVTRAAARLGISQPATSAALAKLRRHFGDKLLDRDGNTYELTPLGLQLLEPTSAAVAMTDRVLFMQAGFDPLTAAREFTVAVSDYTLALLGGTVSQLIESRAPNVRLRLSQLNMEITDEAGGFLRKADAALLPHGVLHDTPHCDLLDDEWMCLVAADNRAVGDELTVAQLCELSWVFTYFHPISYTVAMQELRTQGINPRVRIFAETYAALPTLITGTDRIALIQRRLVEHLDIADTVRALPCPVPLAPLTMALWWHASHATDAGHRWLRQLFAEAARRKR